MPYPSRPTAPPKPKRYRHPRLWAAYQASSLGSWEIALLAGFPHQAHFSRVINREVIEVTPLVVERLQRVADILGVPRDCIFLSDPAEQQVEAACPPSTATC